jgi:hypothetical protein
MGASVELRVSEGSAAVTNEAGGAFGSSARRVTLREE